MPRRRHHLIEVLPLGLAPDSALGLTPDSALGSAVDLTRGLAFVLPFALALGFATTSPTLAAPAEPGPDNLVLACTGPFAEASDAKTLASVFGAVNVREEEVGGAEGETIRATVLYPDDPARRLEIAWWDEETCRRPASIRAREDGSTWRIAGIGVGSTLAAATLANGGPFTLSGFGWDYGGLVTDWNEGSVPKAAGTDCRVQVGFTTEAQGPDRIMGDGVALRSDDPDMLTARPTVIEIGIGWPEK